MSKKFKFGLDKLLEMRKEQEEQSKRLFNESQKKKLQIEEKLIELTQSYEKYKGINSGEDLVYQKLKRYYLIGLNKGIKNAKDDLKVQMVDLDKKRKELIEKQVQRKTVEILKEKKKAEFIKEEQRIEQINLDELALYAHIRKQQI